MLLDQFPNNFCSGLHKLIQSLYKSLHWINNLENGPGKTKKMPDMIFSISLVTPQRNFQHEVIIILEFWCEQGTNRKTGLNLRSGLTWGIELLIRLTRVGEITSLSLK